jgi:hypothetical protein
MKYIIKDWAGITMNWEGNPFEDLDQACDTLYSMVTELTSDELARGDTEYKDYDFDDLWEINLGEFQIIEEE